MKASTQGSSKINCTNPYDLYIVNPAKVLVVLLTKSEQQICYIKVG